MSIRNAANQGRCQCSAQTGLRVVLMFVVNDVCDQDKHEQLVCHVFVVRDAHFMLHAS